MTRSTRYILRQLATATVVILFALTAAVWLTQSLRFVDLIINKVVSVGVLSYLAMLLLPGLLSLILPIALFCAVLYTYHRLNTDSELLVLRAAGLSQWALAKPAIIVATAVTILLYALTTFLAPRALDHRGPSRRVDGRGNYQLMR